ncbi:amidohydrolase family protein [Microbacterium oxydans]|nr:amidohydrolase family protein [Microbacterium oxydans]
MDTLLRGGRVIDPKTETDRITDLLLADGRVAALGDGLTAPADAEVVDATGLIVGPGFVDLHSHVHSIAGQRLQAMDGVTTALDLEAGLMPIAEALARAAADGRPLNYGFSASWSQARAYAHLDRVPVADFTASMDLLGKAGVAALVLPRGAPPLAGVVGGRTGGRCPRHRRAHGVRATLRSGRVPRPLSPRRRRARSDLHACARADRSRPPHSDRRL